MNFTKASTRFDEMHPFTLGLHLEASITKLNGQIEELYKVKKSSSISSAFRFQIVDRIESLKATRERLIDSLSKVTSLTHKKFLV